MKTINIGNEKDEYKVYEVILHWIETRIYERMLTESFGTKRTDDEATREYYIVSGYLSRVMYKK